MKVKMPLTELRDVDVEFISLVKRGANQIPFRIVKSEGNPMKVLGIVAKEGQPLPASLVESKKYEVLDQSVLTKEDISLFDKGSFLLAVEGVSKQIAPYTDSLSFSDAANAYNVYPTVLGAFELAQNFIMDCMTGDKQKSDTVQKADAILAAMHSYVVEALNKLPEDAYMTWKEEAPAAVVADETPTLSAAAEVADEKVEPVTVAEAVKEPEAAEKSEPVSDKVVTTEPEKPVASTAKSETESLKAELVQVLETLKAEISTLKEQLTESSASMKTMQETVVTAKAEVEALKSTVVIPVPGEKTKDSTLGKQDVKPRSIWDGTALDALVR